MFRQLALFPFAGEEAPNLVNSLVQMQQPKNKRANQGTSTHTLA